MGLSVCFDEHFIQVPLISGSRTPPSQAICELLAELQTPLANSLVCQDYTTLSHQQFDISVAE
jgi:hypothetical protein